MADLVPFIKMLWGNPVGKIVIAFVIFVLPGLLGRFIVDIPNNIGWLRYIFEIIAVIIAAWGIKEIPKSIAGNKTKKKLRKAKFQQISIFLLVATFAIFVFLATYNDINTNEVSYTQTASPALTLISTPSKSETPTITPSPTFTLTPTPEFLLVSEAMKQFYDVINNAKIKSDLEPAWEMQFPCCTKNLDSFSNEVWKYRIEYKIFGCTENVVVVHETYFPRSDEKFLNPYEDADRKLIRTFEFREGRWVIIKSVDTENSQCTFIFSNEDHDE
jgi:hypothetical protein